MALDCRFHEGCSARSSLADPSWRSLPAFASTLPCGEGLGAFRRAIMELISRITVIRRGDEGPQAVTVYRAPRRRRRVSLLSRPFERAARELLRAQIVFGQEALRRHERS